MNNRIRRVRISKELKHLQDSNKVHGISCSPCPSNTDDFFQLLAIIPGPPGSPYEDGKFEISITIGEHYPFKSPTFKFLTPVYHPNIDNLGKICLDLLRMPPTGSYTPTITLEAILVSIQLLLAAPNPEDPLRGDAADLYKSNRILFNEKARMEVQKLTHNNKSNSVDDCTGNIDQHGSTEIDELIPRKKIKLTTKK